VAAARHVDDAGHLRHDQRLPNADHLAGLAAECALKAIGLAFLGVQSTARAPEATIGGRNRRLGHLPDLWSVLHVLIAGRHGSSSAALLGRPSPFDTWEIDQRYEDGSRIVVSDCDARLTAARQLVACYQQGSLIGAPP
jgi:hypothetical protein